MFTKYQLDSNIFFDNLSESTKFEKITNGRDGAILINNNDIIPIVRSTTKYNNPAQLFTQTHYDIIKNIKKITNIDTDFNNALIEIYSNDYKSMGEHSDQSLDLEDKSYICLFSCYNNPLTKNIRTLKVRSKLNNNNYDFKLDHNSIVIFSNEINKKYLHKIILDNINDDALWLGITFRLSKTFIKFINEIPYFNNSENQLKIATKEESKEYYKCRSMENKLIDYVWTDIHYTISKSDIICLIHARTSDII
jgi:hypothetical protein